MTKPCEACGRVGTIHRLYAKSCLTCDPWTAEDLEWVELTVGNEVYRVQRKDKVWLDHFLQTSRLNDDGTISVTYDTGGCGGATIGTKTRSIGFWMRIYRAEFVRNVVEVQPKKAKKRK